jgi:hypothetical protein
MKVAQDASNPNAISPSNIANVQLAPNGNGHFAQHFRVQALNERVVGSVKGALETVIGLHPALGIEEVLVGVLDRRHYGTGC